MKNLARKTIFAALAATGLMGQQVAFAANSVVKNLEDSKKPNVIFYTNALGARELAETLSKKLDIGIKLIAQDSGLDIAEYTNVLLIADSARLVPLMTPFAPTRGPNVGKIDMLKNLGGDQMVIMTRTPKDGSSFEFIDLDIASDIEHGTGASHQGQGTHAAHHQTGTGLAKAA